MKQWLIIGGIAFLLILSYFWNRNRNLQGQKEEIPPVEEVIVKDDGSVVKKVGDKEQVMSPEEAEAKKKEIEEKLANVPEKELIAKTGQQGAGKSARALEGGNYYQRITVEGMIPLQKGYYYEAWLENDQGQAVSLGRLEMSGVTGRLLYSVNEDKMKYSQVVISREIEDGKADKGEEVLRGKFE